MINIPEGVRDAKRFKQIIDVAIKHGFAGHFMPGKKKRISPVKLRKAMEELGGAFVKLGQLLSLRPDLIPHEYCQEFSRLQDKVKPFPDAKAKKMLYEELKHSASFIKLEKLLASGSIGQVYQARFHKKKIAIKIMRPDIEQVMHTDIDILYHLTKLIKQHVKTRIIDPMEIFEQFRIYTENELDYNVEAKYIEEFYENFLNTDIVIPSTYSQFCTKKILTMDFVEGTSLLKKRMKASEKKEVADKFVNAILKQIFLDGIFHGDPHPGNIFISQGKLAFLDFGIVGRITESMREKLANMFIALISDDVEGVVDSLIALDLVNYDVDRDQLKFDVETIINQHLNKEIQKIRLSDLILSTIKTAKSHRIKLPKDYVLLAKVFVTMEGVGKELCPDYNLVEESKPFVRHLILSKFDYKHVVKRMRKATPEFIKFLLDMPRKTNYFLSELKDLDEGLSDLSLESRKMQAAITHGANRLVMGVVIAALIISFGILLPINGTIAFILAVIAALLTLDVFYSTISDKLRFK